MRQDLFFLPLFLELLSLSHGSLRFPGRESGSWGRRSRAHQSITCAALEKTCRYVFRESVVGCGESSSSKDGPRAGGGGAAPVAKDLVNIFCTCFFPLPTLPFPIGWRILSLGKKLVPLLLSYPIGPYNAIGVLAVKEGGRIKFFPSPLKETHRPDDMAMMRPSCKKRERRRRSPVVLR